MYPVEKACARSCARERAEKKVKKKHDAIMAADSTKLDSLLKLQETMNEEAMELYDKLNGAQRKITALRKSITVSAEKEGPTDSISKQMKKHEKDVPTHRAAIAAIEKKQEENDSAIEKVKDKLQDFMFHYKQEENKAVTDAMYKKQDQYELDFPLAAFEKKDKKGEEAFLPVRDDGVGRLMRFNRVLAGERYPHLLFIDEQTRVLFQIDAGTGRVVQLVDFWKVRYGPFIAFNV